MKEATSVKIELYPSAGGSPKMLKGETALQAGEVIDSSRMSAAKLRGFFEESLAKASSMDLMVSLHLKATMMKVSDPIMFGHAVEVYFKDAFAKHADALAGAGANVNNGLGDVYEAIAKMPAPQREAVEASFAACLGSSSLVSFGPEWFGPAPLELAVAASACARSCGGSAAQR